MGGRKPLRFLAPVAVDLKEEAVAFILAVRPSRRE
jgi:hypothetical protein